MQLSCLPVCFFPEIISGQMSIAEWARMVTEIGLDAIELSILFPPDCSHRLAKSLRHQINSLGTKVAMLATYPDFTYPDPARRREELFLEEEAVALAIELGAELVRVTAGQAHPGIKIQDGVEWAVEGLTNLCEITRGQDITLVYENHAKPSSWEYSDFSQPPDIFLSIVGATEQLGLGINIDTANATAFAEDPLNLLEKVMYRIVSIHAADTNVKGTLHHVALGTGITPFKTIFGKLKQNGWDGWVCMEEASFQGREGVEAAISFTRKAWSAA